MLLSVVIPVLNAASTLPRCLDALAAQSYTDAEFILVDNGSADDSARLIREFAAEHPALNVRLAEETRPGASAARNRGACLASGTWLAFTDADCIPDRSWLADLANAIESHPDAAAFAGSLISFPAKTSVGRFTALFTLPPTMRETTHSRFDLISGGFPSANLAIRKDLFDRLGGFDSSIRIYGEDYDLCRRVYESGNQIVALPDARVKHVHRETLKASLTQAFGFGRSHALLLARMPGKPLILTGPLVSMIRRGGPFPMWLDANQADKKILFLALAGLVWWPFWLVSVVYLAILTDSLRAVAIRRGVRLRFRDVLLFPVLMLFKSGAMTCGRVIGSFRFGVICV